MKKAWALNDSLCVTAFCELLSKEMYKVPPNSFNSNGYCCRYTDVKRKEDRSLFIRPHEGLFGLREWIDEGIEYHVRTQLGLLQKPAS